MASLLFTSQLAQRRVVEWTLALLERFKPIGATRAVARTQGLWLRPEPVQKHLQIPSRLAEPSQFRICDGARLAAARGCIAIYCRVAVGQSLFSFLIERVCPAQGAVRDQVIGFQR